MINVDSCLGTLADAVLNRPREFSIGERKFRIFLPSLGVSILAQRTLSNIGVNAENMLNNPALESLRVIKSKRKETCTYIALHTFRRYSEFCKYELIEERTDFLDKHLDDDELVQLLTVVMTLPRVESLIVDLELDKEQKKQAEIASYKNKDGHNLTFGGKSIYGTLIDAACSKYGWTKEYVVWGIDLLSLRMMLVDAINSVYLNDEELKDLRLSKNHTDRIDMNNPEDMARIKAMDWT